MQDNLGNINPNRDRDLEIKSSENAINDDIKKNIKYSYLLYGVRQ